MDTNTNIKDLRKKQMLLMNVSMFCIVVLFMCITYFGIKLIYLFMIAIVSMTYNIISHFNPGWNIVHKLFPFLKKIEEYEKEKLGAEYIALKKAQLIGYFVIILVMMMNTFIIPADTVLTWPSSLVGGMILIPMAIVSNYSAMRHARKVDGMHIEETAGYARSETRFGLILGISLGLVLCILMVVGVMIIL